MYLLNDRYVSDRGLCERPSLSWDRRSLLFAGWLNGTGCYKPRISIIVPAMFGIDIRAHENAAGFGRGFYSTHGKRGTVTSGMPRGRTREDALVAH